MTTEARGPGRLRLRELSRGARERQNLTPHGTQLEASQAIRGAQINDEITKLCESIDTHDAADRRRFDLPLALRLRKPLQMRR